MTRAVSLAVVGATGLVGEALLEQLAQSGLPFTQVHAVASAESAGKRIDFGDRLLKVEDLKTFDFSQVEVALFAVPPAVSAEYSRQAADQGCLVLDLSGVWLADPSVPVWCERVTGLDPEILHQGRLLTVLSGPAAVAAEVLHALSSLPLACVSVTSLLPSSAGGRATLEELARQTARLLNSQDPQPQHYPAQSAFAMLSAGSAALGSGSLAPSQSLQLALKRLPELAHLEVAALTGWIPAFFGASLGLSMFFSEPVSAALAGQLLDDAGLPATGLEVRREGQSLSADLPGQRPLIADLVAPGQEGQQLGCWIGFENVRYGAAHKGVQILQLLLKDYL